MASPPLKKRKIGSHSRAPKGGIPQKNPFVDMLQCTTVREIIPRRCVHVAYENDSVREVLNILNQYNILSCPILETKTNKFIGFLDMFDIISSLLLVQQENGTWGSVGNDVVKVTNVVDNSNGETVNTGNDNGNGSSISLSILYKDAQFLLQQVGDIIGLSENNPVCNVHIDSPLFNCIGLFQKGVHRVAVISSNGTTENILSQSDVIRFLISKLDEHLDIFEKSVREIFNTSQNKDLITVRSDDLAFNAFKLIRQNKISAVAVINEETGKLIGNLSASDLKGVFKNDEAEPIGSLNLPVSTFLQQGSMSKFPTATCQLNSSFSYVLLKITALNVHRLWIVDDNEIPIGIISLTDIMQAIISQKQEDRRT